ncbi:hypothetical protein MKD33_06725, partial [Chromobacterium piscinae]
FLDITMPAQSGIA